MNVRERGDCCSHYCKGDDVACRECSSAPLALGNSTYQYVINRDLAEDHQHEADCYDQGIYAGQIQHQSKKYGLCERYERKDVTYRVAIDHVAYG